jgi:hypothetical protein
VFWVHLVNPGSPLCFAEEGGSKVRED